jgi:pantothenate kinase type III
LAAGVVHGLRGAAAELVRRIAEETDLVDAPVYLTGGAHALLVQPSAFIARALRVEPNLVHLGLLASIGAHGFEAAK